MVQPLWKTVWQFLKKLNIELPYDPVIPFIGIYPKDLKAGTQTCICLPMFIVKLFPKAKRWKQPRCLSIDKWINKMCSKHKWSIIQP